MHSFSLSYAVVLPLLVVYGVQRREIHLSVPRITDSANRVGACDRPERALVVVDGNLVQFVLFGGFSPLLNTSQTQHYHPHHRYI